MSDTHLSADQLERAYSAKVGTSLFEVPSPDSPDVLAQLLSDKRSPHTREAYGRDLADFFKRMVGADPTQTPGLVQEFLRMEQADAVKVVLKYKSELMKAGLAEATVNRRLSALKALVKYGRKLGACSYSLDDVQGEKVQPYRDTTGVDVEAMRKVVTKCSRSTLKGKRDYALLLLMWENALRRNEVAVLNYSDFDAVAGTLSILGKGQGSKKQTIDLSPKVVCALADWMGASRGTRPTDAAIFYSLDRARPGHRLTGEGIRKIVKNCFEQAGIAKPMSPHRVRHSSITAALDATDGNVRKVQKLSRHKHITTLMLYDDNRLRVQKEISRLLSELL